MSWLAGDTSVLDMHEAENGTGLVSKTHEDLQGQYRRLEALLDTEREAHRLAREEVDESRRECKEWMYKGQEAAAQLQATEDTLHTRNRELKNQCIQRDNLELSLRQAQDRLEAASKQRSLDAHDMASQEAYDLEQANKELEGVLKKNKVNEDGMRFWKEKAQTFESEKLALERQLARPRTRSQDKDVSALARGDCHLCQAKDDELARLSDDFEKLQTQHAQLRAAKSALDNAHMALSNQHAALERSSARKAEELQDELETLRDERDDCKMVNMELEREWSEKVEDLESQARVMKSERDAHIAQAVEDERRYEALQAEIQELERINVEIRSQAERASQAADAEAISLRDQLQSLETHFQSSNSDLLSSRSALQHAQTRLSSLEHLLNKMPRRSFDDDHVLSLRSELEDELRLRSDLETRLESTETRLAEALQTKKNSGADDSLSQHDQAILRGQLQSSTSRLHVSQDSLATLSEEADALQLVTAQLRADRNDKDELIGSLRSELETATQVSAMKDLQLLTARQELSDSRDMSTDKEAELLAVMAELESLKRDATALRDQLVTLQQSQSQSRKSPPSPSPPRKHLRANSAPFSPSPLRHASYPPPAGSSVSVPPLSLDDSDDQSLVLVARLRQERDEAASQLAYYLVEHRISSQCVSDELDALTTAHADASSLVDTLSSQNEEIKGALGAAQEKEQEARQELRQTMLAMAETQARCAQLVAQAAHQDEALAGLKQNLEDYHDKLKEHSAAGRHAALQREELEDQLDAARLELAGARNAALMQEGRARIAQERLEQRDASASTEAELLRDEVERLEVQLEGARNAALSQEERVRQLVQGREWVEGVLRMQRDGLSDQLLREMAGTDILKSDLVGIKREKAAVEGDLVASQTAMTGLIVALAQEAKTSRTASANITQLKAQLQATAVESKAYLEELGTLKLANEALQTDVAALRISSTGLSHPSENELQGLILALAQASSQLRIAQISSASQDKLLQRASLDLSAVQQELTTTRASLSDLEQQASLAAQAPLFNGDLQSRDEKILELTKEIEELRAVQDELDTALQQARSTYNEQAREQAEGAQALLLNDAKILDLQAELDTCRHDLQTAEERLSRSEQDLETLKESLRAAEDEGRNLVDDFNALSEEFERTQKEITTLQKEDETKSMQSGEYERRLADALAMQQELTQQSEDAITTIRDLEVRIKQLEDDLENKQVEIEETDDRYLASLKTIKKQEISLDKLKVRIEALQRANALLSRAVPATTPDVLAPAPASAKKRGLPQEFVAPDPGPAAIVVLQQRQTKTMTVEVSKTVEPQLNQAAIVAKPVTKAAAMTDKVVASKPVASTTALSANKPRKPLAAVQAQAAPQTSSVNAKASEAVKIPAKLGYLSSATTASRPAFKPTPSLSSRPLAAKGEPKDTKSLLAALQALKRPAV